MEDSDKFTALAFKIMSNPFVGRLTYFRVYSGKLKAGSYVSNATSEKKERIARLLRMHANHREEVEEVHAGDIVAAIGLSSAGCTTIYTDEDIREEEAHMDEKVRAAESHDRAVEEAGGVNADVMESEREWGTMESER